MRLVFVVAALLAAVPAVAQEVVATRTLRAGQVLGADDLRVVPSAGVGAAQRMQEMVGQETRRAIFAGREVHRGDLGPPTLVARNAIVTMHYRNGGLGIRTEGRALEAGGLGEPIRVMNLSSRLAILARIIGPNTVEVSP
ncbi:MAG: flagellar basal body P-ring formation chaperone FlgA [Pseudomonadota bacterium]